MPAYSFQERFVPFVRNGTKNQTVRKRRAKGFARKGDTLYLYYGLRTKWCTKLKEAECTDAKTIVITKPRYIERMPELYIFSRRLQDDEIEIKDGDIIIHRKEEYCFHQLLNEELDRFAWDDGFRPDGSTRENPVGCWRLMCRYWMQTHELPFVGDLIKW
jgi:hypothetical protein